MQTCRTHRQAWWESGKERVAIWVVWGSQLVDRPNDLAGQVRVKVQSAYLCCLHDFSCVPRIFWGAWTITSTVDGCCHWHDRAEMVGVDHPGLLSYEVVVVLYHNVYKV